MAMMELTMYENDKFLSCHSPGLHFHSIFEKPHVTKLVSGLIKNLNRWIAENSYIGLCTYKSWPIGEKVEGLEIREQPRRNFNYEF